MKEIGQKPVIVKKEVYGFAINRMQYAIINECWRLVQDGVMSVEDIDAVMSEGLGMRYAFLGVFETCHLNADGKILYLMGCVNVYLCIQSIQWDLQTLIKIHLISSILMLFNELHLWMK